MAMHTKKFKGVALDRRRVATLTPIKFRCLSVADVLLPSIGIDQQPGDPQSARFPPPTLSPVVQGMLTPAQTKSPV